MLNLLEQSVGYHLPNEIIVVTGNDFMMWFGEQILGKY